MIHSPFQSALTVKPKQRKFSQLFQWEEKSPCLSTKHSGDHTSECSLTNSVLCGWWATLSHKDNRDKLLKCVTTKSLITFSCTKKKFLSDSLCSECLSG